jgi:signal transduction histidine kinase
MSGVIRDRSLRFKAPLAIAATLFVGVAAFGALAYDAVSRSLVASTELRMASAASQIIQLGVPQNAARERRAREVAANPAIVAALRSPASINLSAIRATLLAWGRDSGLLVATEIRDLSGTTIATMTERPAFSQRITTPVTDTVSLGRLFAVGDTIYTEFGAPVRDGDRIIGRVSQVRIATSGSASLQRVRDLFSFDSRVEFLLGNSDGSVWIDLTKRVERPGVTAAMARYVRGGTERIAMHAAYPNSPLVLAVEAPITVLAEPARRLLWAFVTIGVLVVGVGIAIGWWLTAGLTGPLVRLTHAAEEIARGHLSPPDIAIDRGDEIGRLGRAFTHMRDSVRLAHDSLESQVAARTEELRRAQDALVRKERLATLGQLSSSVGHELRNPLGVMTNAVYFLEMTLRDPPAKVGEYLGILRTQIRLSEKIVTDLLDFARTRPPQRARARIGEIVDEQLGRVTIPQGVKVDRAGVDQSVTVFVDSVQVGQIVLNLLTNAVQAMDPAGGTLTIRSHANSSFVHLDVVDTGPGITAENLPHVFEPLFTTKARGIGLGLSVSRTLAAGNGGELTVESVPGKGATFSLALPLGTA